MKKTLELNLATVSCCIT